MGNSNFILWRVPPEPRPWYKIILWWELRRILYNILLAVTWIVGDRIANHFYGFVDTEVLGILLYVVGANICYTSGWMVELILRSARGGRWPKFGAVAFMGGLLFSVALSLLLSTSVLNPPN